MIGIAVTVVYETDVGADCNTAPAIQGDVAGISRDYERPTKRPAGNDNVAA